MNTSFLLKNLAYTRIELPLAKPFTTSTKTVKHRTVLSITAHIQLKSPTNNLTFTGHGEAAPLPGWSHETIDECIETLHNLPLNQTFNSIAALDAVYPDLHKLPTLRAGIELAILDALACNHNTSIATLIASHYNPTATQLPTKIPVQNTLGAANTKDTIDHAIRTFSAGFSHLKLKVGVATPHQDLDRIAQVHAACPDITLRLDANSAWSIPTAIQFCQSIQNLPESLRNAIDLIEQPVAPANLEAFMHQLHTTNLLETTLKIAPDEGCITPATTHNLIKSGLIHAIVLKPATLGGLLPTAELMTLALQNNVRVILSNLLESNIGRHAAAQLAAAFPQFTGPHGLATGNLFLHDPTPEPTSKNITINGHINLPPHTKHYQTPTKLEAQQ